MKVNDMMRLWRSDFEQKGLKTSTINRYETILKGDILRRLSEAQVNNKIQKELLVFSQELANYAKNKTYSTCTLNLTITIVNNLFSFGVANGIIKEQWFRRIKLFKEVDKRIKVFDDKEIQRIEEYILSSSDKSLLGMLISLKMGFRLGEVLGLTKEDVDLKLMTIRVSKTKSRVKIGGKWVDEYTFPKTHNAVREVPIPTKLWKCVKKAVDGNLKFIVEDNFGRPLSIRQYQRKFQWILNKLYIEDATYHSTRHAFATKCIEKGVDVKTLSEILGHSNVIITLSKYVHTSIEMKRKALKKIE